MQLQAYATIQIMSLPRGTILLVEDDAILRLATETLLSGQGYDVVSACDGQDAIDLLKSGLQPALILLDLNMPRIDGWTVLKEIERTPEWATIPIIIVSSDAHTVEKHRIKAAICKPFQIEALIQAISENI